MKGKFMWAVQVEAKKGEYAYLATVVNKDEATRIANDNAGSKVVRVKVYA